MPRTPDKYFPSGHFRTASLRGLGAISAPRGSTCAIPSRGQTGQQEELCGQLLDPQLAHAAVCKKGPARMRPHRHLAAAMADCLKLAGADIDLERTVIELAQTNEDGTLKEAVLDLYVLWPGSVTPYYIDVTI